MIDQLAVHGLQYLGYAVEISVVVMLLARGRWKKYPEFFLYVLAYAGVDVVFRPAVISTYGVSSTQYSYCYWISDVALTLSAFLLICLFFKRACASKKEDWPFFRSILGAVFILIAAISYFSLSSHYDHLLSHFIVEFQQNLYFTCLVLNTLLYIKLAQTESVDEELSLLVCGLGIEFAGPAAGLAFWYLTGSGPVSETVVPLAAQLCTIGTYLVWLYAATRSPQADAESASFEKHEDIAALAKLPVRVR